MARECYCQCYRMLGKSACLPCCMPVCLPACLPTCLSASFLPPSSSLPLLFLFLSLPLLLHLSSSLSPLVQPLRAEHYLKWKQKLSCPLGALGRRWVSYKILKTGAQKQSYSARTALNSKQPSGESCPLDLTQVITKAGKPTCQGLAASETVHHLGALLLRPIHGEVHQMHLHIQPLALLP